MVFDIRKCHRDRRVVAEHRVARRVTDEQEVDPGANAAAALDLVAGLEQELAEAEVALDLLAGLDRGSPRVRQIVRRSTSLEGRIDAERGRLGRGGNERAADRPLSDLVGDYEDLVAEREFAEQTHALALAA